MKPVYFAPLGDDPALDEQVAAMKKLAERQGLSRAMHPGDFVAIKLHVGEANNTTHVRPELIRAIVDAARRNGAHVFLTETSTLYKGERDNAVKHILLTQAHGFGIERTGAPFIMADGLTGGNEVEVAIDGGLERTVKIAREIAFCDALIAVSHPTGHMHTGLGACLKNLGMGLASRAGKLRQHSSILPWVNAAQCRGCRKCAKWCPAAAIEERGGRSSITEKCIGCGECLTVCRYDAIEYDWEAGSGDLQKRMVEHAYGAIKDKMDRSFFFNVLVGMTRDCDCVDVRQKKLLPDVGILASSDPVAIDQATLDLTRRAGGESLARLAYGGLDPAVQLNHAVGLGMGSLQYELIGV